MVIRRSSAIICLLLALAVSCAHAQSQPPFVVPAGATAISGSGGGTVGPVTAVLGATLNAMTNYCAFEVDVVGGTINTITVAGLVGSTVQIQSFAPAQNVGQQKQVFTPCLTAFAPSSSIAVTATADGNPTAVSVNVWGYTQ